jgi:hypothetical protein
MTFNETFDELPAIPTLLYLPVSADTKTFKPTKKYSKLMRKR